MKNLLLLLSLFTCLTTHVFAINKIDKVLYKTINQFIKQTESPNLHAVAIGGGAPTGKIEKFTVYFKCSNTLTLESARSLIVECGNNFISEINNSKHIKEHVIAFPITSFHIDIGITAKVPEYKAHSYIKAVSCDEGNVYYYAKDENPKEIAWVTVHRETFEEAQRIVMSKRNE